MKSTIKAILKRLKSKTYWLSILVAVQGQMPLAQDLMGEYYGLACIVIAALIAGMREATKGPVSQK